MKDHLFKWVWDPRPEQEGQRLYGVGLYADGTIRNPEGYPESLVREAVERAVQSNKEWRSAIAKKAAETRALRRKHKIERIARSIIAGTFSPGKRCAICSRALTDEDSIQRGIGPECSAPLYAFLDKLARQEDAEAQKEEATV
jgi:hypothetical protein